MKINNRRSNYLVFEGSENFDLGLLFPHNILFKGEEVSLPFAYEIMQRLRSDENMYQGLGVLSHFGPDLRYAILTFESEMYLKGVSNNESLRKGVVYSGVLLAKSAGINIVGVNGNYGYVHGILTDNIGDEINVSVIENSRNQFTFCRFAKVENENNELSELDESQTIEVFLSSEELAAISDDEREKIEWLLDNVDGLNRNNINVFKGDLHISYRPSSMANLSKFLNENPRYFENNFWVSSHYNKETGDIKIIIYDIKDVVLECLVNSSGIWLNEFSHDKNNKNAQFLLDHNRNALIISGKHIHFHEDIYFRNDYEITGQKLYMQFYVSQEILPGLRRTIKTLKEKAGVEYITLRKYLAYQESQEVEFNKEHSITIHPKEAGISTTEGNNISSCLVIKGRNEELSSLFSQHDNDSCHVELIRGNENLKAVLRESAANHGYTVEFFNYHFSLSDWQNSGFEIRRKASINHLTLQQESINDFVYGNDEFDIFDKLNNGLLCPPEDSMDYAFFDEKFNNVESGNNQPVAIRKAVNNNDIFLIQGPPGTGKTSVIVEIIKQLVINRGEKVLVCSQAHSAVKNIYDRLKDAEGIKIGNIDVEETMFPEDIKDHPALLRNNGLLLKNLSEENANILEIKSNCRDKYGDDYSEGGREDCIRHHEYICDYYKDNVPKDTLGMIEIFEDLRNSLVDLGDNALSFIRARHYQGLNVVMGTCIGIGMDWGLKVSGMKFDTVIIDEAGKANLSETTVPMQLGKKFILVGDQNQLPPYMDREEIDDFLASDSKTNLTKSEVEEALSSSLFEDFLEDENFPKENTVLLNYQYRMNPDIGNYISELFYNSGLMNGRGTENQHCHLDGFPQPVTFIDTSTKETNDRGKNIAWEDGDPAKGWYNAREVEVFNTRLKPRLEQLLITNPQTAIGIITPYRKQRNLFIENVKGTPLEGMVYTIDSIQGSEFDVVVLSLVRSFNTKWKNRKVGFLDDMRRLNVALSRAKKRLIIIGNLSTLCNENAHFETSDIASVRPVEVFKKLKEIQERTALKTSLEVIKQELSQGNISENHIFHDVAWEPNPKGGLTQIVLKFNDKPFYYSLGNQDTKLIQKYSSKSSIDVMFLGIGEDGRAKFKYIPPVTIARLIEDGFPQKVVVEPVEWVKNEANNHIMCFRFNV